MTLYVGFDNPMVENYREIATGHQFTASNCGFIHIFAHHIKSGFIISL
jgi:hypothetical protein